MTVVNDIYIYINIIMVIFTYTYIYIHIYVYIYVYIYIFLYYLAFASPQGEGYLCPWSRSFRPLPSLPQAASGCME